MVRYGHFYNKFIYKINLSNDIRGAQYELTLNVNLIVSRHLQRVINKNLTNANTGSIQKLQHRGQTLDVKFQICTSKFFIPSRFSR